MAKISLNKIAPLKKLEPVTKVINDQEVSIVQYLPIDEKMVLVQEVINGALDANNFTSPGRIEAYFGVNLIKYYTNISITEKAYDELPKTYDALKMNGVIDAVIEAIPAEEYSSLSKYVHTTIDYTNEYFHSFLGILKSINNDYDQTELNLENLMGVIKDPAALSTLKDILEKIG